MNHPDKFGEFATVVAARLEEGAKSYGGRSCALPPEELVREIEERFLDVCGWSFVLWSRIEALREQL